MDLGHCTFSVCFLALSLSGLGVLLPFFFFFAVYYCKVCDGVGILTAYSKASG